MGNLQDTFGNAKSLFDNCSCTWNEPPKAVFGALQNRDAYSNRRLISSVHKAAWMAASCSLLPTTWPAPSAIPRHIHQKIYFLTGNGQKWHTVCGDSSGNNSEIPNPTEHWNTGIIIAILDALERRNRSPWELPNQKMKVKLDSMQQLMTVMSRPWKWRPSRLNKATFIPTAHLTLHTW